jgi:hypothetical protein
MIRCAMQTLENKKIGRWVAQMSRSNDALLGDIACIIACIHIYMYIIARWSR